MKRLELYIDASGDWRWRVWRKGRILCDGGEGYKRRATMLKTLAGLFLLEPATLCVLRDTTEARF